jgi:integrase
VSPENTRRGAERFERTLRARLQKGLPLDGHDTETDPPNTNGKGVLTFKAFSVIFMETFAAVHNSAAEQEGKRGHLRFHLLPAFGHMRLDQIGTVEIAAFTARLSKETTRRGKLRSPKTINNILATLSKLLNWAVEMEKLDRKPRVKLLKIPRTKPKFLEYEAYEALLEATASEPVWHAAILLGGDAGLRLGEIRALRASHCHGDRIVVQRAFWRSVEKEPKGKRTRTVPISKRLQDALARLDGDHRYLVSFDPARELTMEEIRYLDQLCERAGIERIGWHVLRHTYCTHLAMAGAPARTIKELAGHQDLSTTLQYMHLTEGASDDAVRALVEHRWSKIRSKSGQIEDPEDTKPPEI